MKERPFEAGEVIYREGDPGDAVYVVKEGKVEVLRTISDELVRLTVIGGGAIFGEMGVLRNRPRSTTVRAIEAVNLLVIPKEDFLAAFPEDNPLTLSILQLLCERLLQADSQLLEQGIYSTAAMIAEIKEIRVLAASPEVESQIGTEGVKVKRLPFFVGRRPEPGDTGGPAKVNLAIHAPRRGQLAQKHFSLQDQDGRLVLRDLDSELGTLVNGRRIAQFELASVADLRFGENRIQTGGLESPYRFHVIVERKEARKKP